MTDEFPESIQGSNLCQSLIISLLLYTLYFRKAEAYKDGQVYTKSKVSDTYPSYSPKYVRMGGKMYKEVFYDEHEDKEKVDFELQIPEIEFDLKKKFLAPRAVYNVMLCDRRSPQLFGFW